MDNGLPPRFPQKRQRELGARVVRASALLTGQRGVAALVARPSNASESAAAAQCRAGRPSVTGTGSIIPSAHSVPCQFWTKASSVLQTMQCASLPWLRQMSPARRCATRLPPSFG